MSRVLLDENILVGLRNLLDAHEVFSVEYQGWKGLTNGSLMAAAEAARFDVLVTADRNIRFQQSGRDRSIAVFVLSTMRWRDIQRAAQTISDAINRAGPGGYHTLELGNSR